MHSWTTNSAYKLLLVAFPICSSRAVLAEDDHQLIIVAIVSLNCLGREESGENGRARSGMVTQCGEGREGGGRDGELDKLLIAAKRRAVDAI